ncbi:TPA: DNA translocase FtsK [Staphylococcus aureus]|uniref:FtsK/SpoIIIE domain-containing protein n=1 Tax=Staphylococcus aureus TaxID=1280 RepID=UPI000B7F6C2E|nr:FtsK/SpoIIIE domain-containing protein [Staphylococcus aureus]HDA2604493.1 DNA translocase FtsK [Staphylococcus aureus]HDE0230061.1 DNA translocase FtsK [Staphylococcus aureus]HEE8759885.1 DNA translocase FtsK [Staphylococcus aureus]
MAKNGANHYPYARLSRILWKIGKYLTILFLLWYVFVNFILYFLSLGLKKLVDSDGVQWVIDIFNHIIGFATTWQIPPISGLGDSLHQWVLEHKSVDHASLILWMLVIVVILYLGTIILRHHYREQAPFLNDMEAKWLKLKMRFALGASKDSMYDEDKKFKRKVELAARRRLRWMRVYIHTKKQQGEAVPTKEYEVKIMQPSNEEVDNVLKRKIRNMPIRLRKQSGGVTFGDMETTTDGKWYRYRGSKEAKLKEARSIKKARIYKENKQTPQKSEEKLVQGLNFEPVFPLDLFTDRSGSIKEKTEKANEFAVQMQQKITDFLTSTEKRVTHQNTHVGNTSIMYKYKVAFSKSSSSDKQSKIIEDGLSDVLEVEGIIVQGGSGYLRITLPLKEGEDDNVKYDYTIPIDVKTMIEKVMFSNPTDMILGITPESKIISLALAKAPHLLLAGETGSGKSVNIQQMLITMMVHHTPEYLRIGIIDPKEVDFQFYEDLPYMIANPIQDMAKARVFMEYATLEMDKRQKMLKGAKVRNIKDYNKWAEKNKKDVIPYWVIVIDEYADLVQMFKDVEEPVKRITQKARAVGIHMIIGTQTPRANILTGQIKANVPMRVSMRVSGSIESSIILDQTGAERLRPQGDMLVKRADKLERAQGAYISDEEITDIFNYLKNKFDKPIFPDFEAEVARANGEEEDELFENGKVPNSTTISTNVNRMRPEPSKTTQKSIKGKTNVSTSITSMQKLKERARKRREASEAGKLKDIEKFNREPKRSSSTKKKQMDMDFFLGRK